MDIQILLWIQSFREAIGGCLNSFLTFISTISVDYYVILPSLILFWAVDKRAGLYGLNSLGIGLAGNATLKSTFCVYRPWIRSSELHPLPEVMAGASGYSFPSGHSTSASGLYSGLIAYYRRHKALCVLFAVMVLLTMFSRLYVGVHTPQDVLVGCLVGVVASVIVLLTDRLLQKRPGLDWLVLAVATVAVAALLLYVNFKSYPMDYVDGVLLVDPSSMAVNSFKDPGRFYGIVLGWFVERRFVKFKIEGTTAQKVTRCFLGSLLFVLYWTVVVDPVGKAVGIGIVHFLLQASMPFLFMTVYPLLFTKLERKKK